MSTATGIAAATAGAFLANARERHAPDRNRGRGGFRAESASQHRRSRTASGLGSTRLCRPPNRLVRSASGTNDSRRYRGRRGNQCGGPHKRSFDRACTDDRAKRPHGAGTRDDRGNRGPDGHPGGRGRVPDGGLPGRPETRKNVNRIADPSPPAAANPPQRLCN
jgi:hypothetical protein